MTIILDLVTIPSVNILVGIVMGIVLMKVELALAAMKFWVRYHLPLWCVSETIRELQLNLQKGIPQCNQPRYIIEMHVVLVQSSENSKPSNHKF